MQQPRWPQDNLVNGRGGSTLVLLGESGTTRLWSRLSFRLELLHLYVASEHAATRESCAYRTRRRCLGGPNKDPTRSAWREPDCSQGIRNVLLYPALLPDCRARSHRDSGN